MITHPFMTVYIVTSDHPNLVTRYDDVIGVDKLENGKVILLRFIESEGWREEHLKNVISCEVN